MGALDWDTATPAEIRWGAGRVLPARVLEATTLPERLIGLIGSDPLPEGSGLLFERCACVHTFGMSRPVALLWLGPSEGCARRVVSLDSSIPPCRVIAGPRGSVAVLEMEAWDAPEEREPPCELLFREVDDARG